MGGRQSGYHKTRAAIYPQGPALGSRRVSEGSEKVADVARKIDLFVEEWAKASAGVLASGRGMSG